MYDQFEVKCSQCKETNYLTYWPDGEFWCDWQCELEHYGFGWYLFLKVGSLIAYAIMTIGGYFVISCFANMPVSALLGIIILLLIFKQ